MKTLTQISSPEYNSVILFKVCLRKFVMMKSDNLKSRFQLMLKLQDQSEYKQRVIKLTANRKINKPTTSSVKQWKCLWKGIPAIYFKRCILNWNSIHQESVLRVMSVFSQFKFLFVSWFTWEDVLMRGKIHLNTRAIDDALLRVFLRLIAVMIFLLP